MTAAHSVLGNPTSGPWPEGYSEIAFGMGCFWGAERMFWQLDGVYTTLVGYSQGSTENPSYEQVCSGRTGHVEAVKVVWDPSRISLETLLKTFWEGHDPTQGMRQGNDIGTQYRSGIYWTTDSQRAASIASLGTYQQALVAAGRGTITSEVEELANFWPAEDYHQQYLHKVPNGYCGLGGTGVSCPAGLGIVAD